MVVRDFDVVVVGSGVAGLFAALQLAPGPSHPRRPKPRRSKPFRVALITKTPDLPGGSSALAQGGMAAAMGDDDSPDVHAADTLAAAAGLADAEVATLIARAAPGLVARLIELGARFDTRADGRLSFGREAAHSRRRILHAGGDATGRELVRALAAAASVASWIDVHTRTFAWDVVSGDDGNAAGVLAYRHGSGWTWLRAPAVVLATGGAGQVWLHTTNPRESTGDGLAMAARAGARLADLEFVQFHPTALDAAPSGAPRPLLTEALRGEGAVLLDAAGHRFMTEVHPLAELAPRDVVARAVYARRAAGEAVFLDARTAVGDRFPQAFPTVFALCAEAGIDPRVTPIPVAPAAHYLMGGVASDDRGRSTRPGLWACGEVASTGLHGANRLASNSLLEAMVCAARAADDIRDASRSAPPAVGPTPPVGVPIVERSSRLLDVVRRSMYEDVGVVRCEAGLDRALDRLAGVERAADAARRAAPNGATPEAICAWGELRNALCVAQLVTTAARGRRESRGAHFRTDHPTSDDAWRHHQYVTPTAAELAS